MVTDTGDPSANNFKFYNDENTVLFYEFKVQIAEYLSTLKNTSERTLADLIAFNIEHCSTEMRYFGQEVFQLAEATSGNLQDPVYLAARAANLDFARNGINLALARGDLDAIVAPTSALLHRPLLSPDIRTFLSRSAYSTRQAGWALDVQRISCGTNAPRLCLRYRAGHSPANTTGIPRHHPG